MLECVVNVSEGQRVEIVAGLALAAGRLLLDVHSDEYHNRSVLTLAGPPGPVMDSVRTVAGEAVARLDLRAHHGVHPRIGVLDVVPWVPLTQPALAGAAMQRSRSRPVKTGRCSTPPGTRSTGAGRTRRS